MWRPPGSWHRLVHVCRRWRSVVFMSPNFLDLRLVCYPWTRLEFLGIWPPLPIVIRDMIYTPSREDYVLDAAIVHRNRVCEIYLTRTPHLQRLTSAMQGQFPALTHFKLDYFGHYDTNPTLPDDFLVGTAPRLQFLELQFIAFPALPKLLLSVTDLVYLSLSRIPHSGYISPEAIVTGLAVLTNLKYLNIGFESRPDQESRHSLPPTRTVLPSLTSFRFQGVSQYLEGLLARIDAPLLDSIRITFVYQRIFDSPQLTQFMRRSVTERFQTLNEAHVYFDSTCILVQSSYFVEKSWLIIMYQDYGWELPSFLAQVITSIFPSFYKVERLYIRRPRYLLSQWLNDIENLPWPELFHPFTAVKNLYVCKEFAQCITLALGERRTGALPTLECLFLEEEFQPSEPVQEAIGMLVAARQLLGHPLTVSRWDRYWQ